MIIFSRKIKFLEKWKLFLGPGAEVPEIPELRCFRQYCMTTLLERGEGVAGVPCPCCKPAALFGPATVRRN